MPTMYNRNYGGFDYVRIHSELLTSLLNRKLTHIKPVTDGYTKPLCTINKPAYETKPSYNTTYIFNNFVWAGYDLNKSDSPK